VTGMDPCTPGPTDRPVIHVIRDICGKLPRPSGEFNQAGTSTPSLNLTTISTHQFTSPSPSPSPSPPLHSLAMNLASSRLLLPRSLRHSSPLSYYSCSSSRRLLSTTPVAAPDGYTASNDEVARLATNPLKPLTLRDLVRYVSLP
jgi:hypothetical protein